MFCAIILVFKNLNKNKNLNNLGKKVGLQLRYR